MMSSLFTVITGEEDEGGGRARDQDEEGDGPRVETRVSRDDAPFRGICVVCIIPVTH